MVSITSKASSVVVTAKGGATEPWLFTVDGKPCNPTDRETTAGPDADPAPLSCAAAQRALKAASKAAVGGGEGVALDELQGLRRT